MSDCNLKSFAGGISPVPVRMSCNARASCWPIGSESLTGPAFLDHGDQVVRDVEATGIVPAVLEPLDELGTRVHLQHIDVQFSLPAQARHREIAAADKADDRIEVVGPMSQVEFRVQRMTEKEFHRQLVGAKLSDKPPQADFIGRSGNPDGQLLLKFQSGLAFEPGNRLVVRALRIRLVSKELWQIILRESLHADENTAWRKSCFL